MGLPEEPALPLVEAAEELLAGADTEVVGGADLAGVQGDVGGAGDEGAAEDGADLALLEQVQHAGAQAVEVVGLVAQRDGPRVRLQRRHHLPRQRRRQVQRHEGLRVLLRAPRRPVGEGQQLREPEWQPHRGAGLQRLRRVVVEVAELGDIDLEFAGDFLYFFIFFSFL